MSNVFSCTGTIVRDAEVRYIPSGQAVLNVTVANNIGFGERQQTLWLSVALWGKRAEGSLKNYLKKGQQVFVSGELSQREYRANDGTMKTSLELNANIIDLVGKRSDNTETANTSEPVQNYGSSAPQQQPQPPISAEPEGHTKDDEYDDVPF